MVIDRKINYFFQYQYILNYYVRYCRFSISIYFFPQFDASQIHIQSICFLIHTYKIGWKNKSEENIVRLDVWVKVGVKVIKEGERERGRYALINVIWWFIHYSVRIDINRKMRARDYRKIFKGYIHISDYKTKLLLLALSTFWKCESG